MSEGWKNKLYFGDNLDIMREQIADESVDLIYLDPPFKSNATYNVLFREKNGTESMAQITAFEDTWHWERKSEEIYWDIIEGRIDSPKKLADLMQAMRSFLGTNDMMAYLTMMAPRLLEMRRVLKNIGSIYLHCDPTASHYLKLLMDAVFSPRNFRNEIVWCYTSGGVSKRHFGRKHDIIFFYSKSESYQFEPLYRPYSEKTLKRGLTKVKGKYFEEGLREEGAIMQDWWEIQPLLSPTSKERLGYPTQKPEALIEKIIKSSSQEGDIIMDPFCGCGTTIAVAEDLNRRWIGIDITHLAITLMKHRLENTFGPDLSLYEIIGDPKDIHSAEALAEQNRYQFEWWALSLVDARPAQEKKKGADTGIDGCIYFHEYMTEKAKKVLVQVKSGHVSVRHIRDLKGVLERENAQIGVFITLQEPTKPMKKEAAEAGFYEPEFITYSMKKRYPRIQILTIKELLKGKKLDYPKVKKPTFKKAERKEKKTKHGEMFGEE